MRCRRTLRVNVLVPLSVALSCLTIGGVPAADDVLSTPPMGSTDEGHEGEPLPGVPSDAISVPCASVATTWPVVGGENPPRLTPPQMAVVRTDFRPKDVQLHLDGSFIGRARYFNGKKGYLFLAPGRYRLEARMGGYRSEVFEVEARPNCRFDIRHRMTRSKDTPKESRGDPPGKGDPVERVFYPVGVSPPQEGGDRSGGPDPELRPDLRRPSSPTSTRQPRTSSLVVEVQPETASVYLDGVLLASGAELAMMVGPVAIPEGTHVVEFRAPGFVSRKIELEIGPGELKKITVSLENSGTN